MLFFDRPFFASRAIYRLYPYSNKKAIKHMIKTILHSISSNKTLKSDELN